MCGICGYTGGSLDPSVLAAATEQMRHRGPDEDGFFAAQGVGLGMRRLSVIDLAGGSQPKTDASGTVHVILNGEIYNYRELRQQLTARGYAFSSESDTEVVANGFREWDTDCFRRFSGMFAIAIWDAARDRLVLARDQIGIKPLYYTQSGTHLLFASELKPLLRLLGRTPPIGPAAVEAFLRYQYIPAPSSIFDGVHKLQPGHFLATTMGSRTLDLVQYWSPEQVSPRKDLPSREDELDALETLLRRSVQRQLVSDVPLGAFLSGGVDSSLVVAMMRSADASPIQTFSIRFPGTHLDEGELAELVGRHLGTQHCSAEVSDSDLLRVVEQLPTCFDEPFGDPSTVPTYLLCGLARQHVTVALSGDGPDELFGGYAHHRGLGRWHLWWRLPHAARRAATVAAKAPIRSVRTRACTLLQADLASAYRNVVSVTRDDVLDRVLTGGSDGSSAAWPSHVFEGRNVREAMSLADLKTYLPDDVLTKLDRVSMAHSLEARVPLLDLELVEHALELPPRLRFGGGQKALLRAVVRRHLPDEIAGRPKHGFSVPLAAWIRGPLAEMAHDLLGADALRPHGFFDPDAVAGLLKEHSTGVVDRSYPLWNLLNFQLWYWRYGVPAAQDAGHQHQGRVGVTTISA